MKKNDFFNDLDKKRIQGLCTCQTMLIFFVFLLIFLFFLIWVIFKNKLSF